MPMRLASDSLSVVRGCFQALTITVYYNLQTVPRVFRVGIGILILIIELLIIRVIIRV